MHIASLVVGIISVAFSWIPVWGFILAIAALVISIIAMVVKKTEEKGKGMKIAGIILSIIATVIALFVTISSVLLIKTVVDTGKEIMDDATVNMNQFTDEFVSSFEDAVDEAEDLIDDANVNTDNNENINEGEEIIEAEDKLEESEKELSSMSSSLQNQILQLYNNKIISGAQARSAVNQYMNSRDVTVVLMSADKTQILATVGAKKLADDSIVSKSEYYEITSDDYSAEGGTKHKMLMSDFSTMGSETYMDMSADYNSCVLKLAGTDTVVGIVLCKQ